MGAYWLHDIGIALQGLPVMYYDGWETRSRSTGGFDAILGVCIHHTASSASPNNDMAYMWKNCPDGPVGNFYLGRDGVIWVGAAGAANTQGKGGPLHCSSGTVPLDAGNKFMIAIEAANNGVGEPWPDVQTDSYVRMVRQLNAHYHLDTNQDTHSHYSYTLPSCPGRKVDPAGPSPFGSVNANGTWDINTFRDAVSSGYLPDPIPTSGDDMLYRIKVKGANAKFVGMLDANGLGHTVSWVKNQDEYDLYERLKAPERELGMGDLSGLWLVGSIPTGDTLHQWTGHEFHPD